MTNLKDLNRPRLTILRASNKHELTLINTRPLRDPPPGTDGHMGTKAAAIVEKLETRYNLAHPTLKWKSPACRKRRRHWQNDSISRAVSRLDMPSMMRQKRASASGREDTTPSAAAPEYRAGGVRRSCRHSMLPTPLPISPGGTRATRQYNECSPGSDDSVSPKPSGGRSTTPRSSTDPISESDESDEEQLVEPGNNNCEAPPRKKRKCDPSEDSEGSHSQSAGYASKGILGAAAGLWQTVSSGFKILFTKTYESSLMGIHDLASTENGGSLVYYSAGHKGGTVDGILDCGKDNGWLSAPMSAGIPPQYEWCIIKLGSPGVIKGVVIDTTHVPLDNPMAISIEAAFFAEGELENEIKNAIVEKGPDSNPSHIETLLDNHSLLNDDQWKDVRQVTFVTTPGVDRYSVTTYDRIQTHIRINLFVMPSSLVPANSFVPQTRSQQEHPSPSADADQDKLVFQCGLTRIGIYGEPANPDDAIVADLRPRSNSVRRSTKRNSVRRPSILERRQCTGVTVGRPTPLRPHWLRFRKSVLSELSKLD